MCCLCWLLTSEGYLSDLVKKYPLYSIQCVKNNKNSSALLIHPVLLYMSVPSRYPWQFLSLNLKAKRSWKVLSSKYNENGYKAIIHTLLPPLLTHKWPLLRLIFYENTLSRTCTLYLLGEYNPYIFYVPLSKYYFFSSPFMRSIFSVSIFALATTNESTTFQNSSKFMLRKISLPSACLLLHTWINIKMVFCWFINKHIKNGLWCLRYEWMLMLFMDIKGILYVFQWNFHIAWVLCFSLFSLWGAQLTLYAPRRCTINEDMIWRRI